MSMETEPVAAVCGKQVRIYGPMNDRNVRPLRRVLDFPTRGAALLYASEHDDISKGAVANRQKLATVRNAQQTRAVAVVEAYVAVAA